MSPIGAAPIKDHEYDSVAPQIGFAKCEKYLSKRNVLYYEIFKLLAISRLFNDIRR